MKSIAGVLALAVLVLGTGPTATPAQAKSINARDLILRALKRDQNRCRVKWGRVLAKCKQAQDPTPSDDCGHALPTTSTTTTTTTSTTSSTTTPIKCPPPVSTTTSTTTTTIPCDGNHVWASCGPGGGTCTCHRDIASTGAYTCVEADTQFNRSLGPCPGFVCQTDADCQTPLCLDNPQATVACIKGPFGDYAYGTCLCLCQGGVCP